MQNLALLVMTAAGLGAGISLFLLAVLALRNPHNPNWVQGEAFSQLACFLLTAGLSSTVAVAVNEFHTAGMSVVVAMAASVAVIFVAIFLFCTLFHFGERLRRADAGRSPFERLGHHDMHDDGKAGVH